jgi:hypothetical protein
MSTWYIPLLLLIFLALIAWDLRKVRSDGVVFLGAQEASKEESPITFGWLVFVNLFSLIVVVVTFGMWFQSELLS